MEVLVNFRFHDENEFIDFSKKFSLSSADVKSPEKASMSAKATVEPKQPTMNQKLAAKEASEKKAEASPVREDKTEVENSEADKPVDFDAVKEAVLNLNRKKGRDAAVAVLAKFGAKKVGPELAEKDWAAVIAECDAVLAG